MERKSFSRISISVLMIVVLLISSVSAAGIQVEAKSKYNSNMAKYLKYYKAKNYKKAKKYAKKLKKTKDTSLNKMSSKQKKAYLSKVKKYSFDMFNYDKKEGFLEGYYLADLNGDKSAELLVKHGTCEADFRTEIYTYKGGEAVKVATSGAGHISYIAYPGKGVVTVWGHMGFCSVGLLRIKNGKINTKNYGSQSSVYEYTIPQNFLDNHVDYTNGREVDLSDLQ